MDRKTPHRLARQGWLAVVMLLATLALCCSACGGTSETASPAGEEAGDEAELPPAPPDEHYEGPVTGEPELRVVKEDPFESDHHSIFEGRIKKGQLLNPRLRRHGLSPRQALELVDTLRPLINLDRRVRPGDKYRLALNDEGDVIAFDYRSRRNGEFFVRRQGQSLKVARSEPPELILSLPPEVPSDEAPAGQPRDPGPGSPLVVLEEEAPTDPEVPAEDEEHPDEQTLAAVKVDELDPDEESQRDEGQAPGQGDEAEPTAGQSEQDPEAPSEGEPSAGEGEALAQGRAPEPSAGEGAPPEVEGQNDAQAEAEAEPSTDGGQQGAPEAQAEAPAGGDDQEGQAVAAQDDGEKAGAAEPVAEAQPRRPLTAQEKARQAWEEARRRRVEADAARRLAAEERRKAHEARIAARRAAQAKARREAEEARKARERKARERREEARERAAVAEAERKRREEQRVSEEVELPKNPVGLVKAYYDADNAAERRVIAKRLQRKAGVRGTRRALVRAFKARKQPSGLHFKTMEADGRSDHYAIYVPRRYTPDRAWPLHISLHGGGGNGPATCQRRWGKRWPKDFILVCPTTPGGRWWSPQGEAMALAVYRRVLRDYRIHTDRVTVGGLSNGGTGTLHLATKYPWLWAAVVPRCSARFAHEEWYANMRDMPAFLIHGARDQQIVPSNSQWIVQHLSSLGNKPRYIEVEGGGHDFFSHLNPEVEKWFLPKKRKAKRSFFYERVRGPDPTLIHWLVAQGAGDIEASMKVKGNTTVVRLTTERDPRRLKVYFPNGTLSRNARILLNGKVVFSGRLPVSARHVLESFAASGDLRRVYSGAVTIR